MEQSMIELPQLDVERNPSKRCFEPDGTCPLDRAHWKSSY